MALPLGSFFGNLFRRWLTDTPPFYPIHSNFFLNRTAPILIDVDNLMIVYLSCPHLRLVIDKKAEMMSNMDVKMRDTKTGEMVEDHPILNLFKKPNPLQIQETFLFQQQVMIDIYANAFVYMIRPTSKESPRVLWNLPPQDMKVIPTGKIFEQYKVEDIIKNYQMDQGNGTFKTFDPKDVILLTSGVSTNYITGHSKIKTLQKQISNIDGALKTRNIIINEKGALGILASENKDADGGIPLNTKERERLEKEYKRKYGISDSQSKILLTESNLKWIPMSFPTKDLLLFEEVEEDFQGILGEYGLSRDLFPSTKGATFENQKQALIQTYQNTIQPEADSRMRIFTERFGLKEEGLELIADFSWLPVMQEDEQKKELTNKFKAETLSLMMKDGVLTKEQYAEQMGVELTATEDETSADDKVANAQVELRGTVGGVTGIIEINTAVSQGGMTVDVAVQILVNVYGFDETTARRMVTVPNPTDPNE